MTKNDTETADCFADAFSSVFVNEPIGPLPQHCYKLSDETINEVGISEGDVYQELESVNIYKSSGPRITSIQKYLMPLLIIQASPRASQVFM